MPCCHAYMTVFEPIRNRHFETAIRLYVDVSVQWEDPQDRDKQGYRVQAIVDGFCFFTYNWLRMSREFESELKTTTPGKMMQ